MRVSELIALLQQSLEQDGDLEAVVCGLDQCGYLSVSVVNSALPVVVSDNQIVCEYEDQKGPNDDHLHVTYIGCGETKGMAINRLLHESASKSAAA